MIKIEIYYYIHKFLISKKEIVILIVPDAMGYEFLKECVRW